MLEGKGLDYKSEQNMDVAAEIIDKEIAKYEKIQEKFRKDKNSLHNEDEQQLLMRELKSSMLLQAMYNLEEKMKIASDMRKIIPSSDDLEENSEQ